MEKVNPLAFWLSRQFLAQFLRAYLFLALCTCAGAYVAYRNIQEHISIRDRIQQSIAVELEKDAINNVLDGIKLDIRLLSNHPELKNVLDHGSPQTLPALEADLLNLSAAAKSYEQIGWIDETGHERMLINFNHGTPTPTPANELQDISGRYYFLAAIKLKAGEVYVSTLDLNVEHPNLEFPHQPVLRMAAPVFDSLGKPRGIIMVNYFGAELLARFEKAGAKIAGHSMLLNPQGFWMNSPLPDKRSSFISTPTTPSFSEHRPSIWAWMAKADQGQFEDNEGVWSFSTVYPDQDDNVLSETANAWKIVALLPAKTLYGNLDSFNAILWPLLTLLLLEAAGCWKLASLCQYRSHLQDQLLQSNRHLQNLVAARTAQLEGDIALREQAEKQLQLLNSALKAAANAIVITDSQSVIQWANPAFSILTGFPVEEALGRPPKDLIRSGLQSEAFYLALSNSIINKRVWRGEISNTHRDGSLYTESLTITPICDPESGNTHCIAVKENISDRKQTETHLVNLTRVYTMLSNINHAIVHLRDRDTLLREACRIAIEDGGFSMAWIGLPDTSGETLQPTAFAGIDKETLEQLNNLPTPNDQISYPANAAYAQACNVGSNDIEHDPRTQAWRHKALALGYRSMLALPIRVNGGVRGVYSLYAGAAEVFTDREIKLLDDLANDIGFALEVAEVEAERRRAEERWRHAAAVFENTHEGVMITDSELRIHTVNRAFTDITGYGETEILGKKPSHLSSNRHNGDFYAELWASVSRTGHWQGEIWNQRKNGEIYPELLNISAIEVENGRVTGYIGVFSDISDLKASEAKMEFLAHHDPLTQLPNRLVLFSRLEHGIAVAKREHKQLALLMLDLDRFKDINDSFGHLTGDKLLQQAAMRLTRHLREADTVTRLGGDEFTVLLENITRPEDAARVANILIAALSEPWQLANGIEARIGVSVGISLFPDHGGSAGELLQHADAALYQAKADGRGCFKYFSEELTVAARERIVLESRLRHALADHAFRLYYQPQVDIGSGLIIGAEALLRWQDPQYGLIPPERFIPIAESTGLIGAISEWVLKECCAQGMRWIEAGLPALTLAVNISPHQFSHNGLVEMVSRILSASGFPAMRLELELTESALMTREKQAVETLNRLRNLGVRLAIDDFGTGYSSLAYLKRFPLDVLKIDKSFVDDIPNSQDDKEIAATIIAMAHTLRFKVLAEGVETQAQLAFLQDRGCDAYQGYWKSPPLPADEFTVLLLGESQKSP